LQIAYTCAEELIEGNFGVRIFIIALAVAFGLSTAACGRAKPGASEAKTGASEWTSDYKKAQQEAKADHKLVLLNFTGSDWCGYCFQFDRAILSQPQFKDYANKNLILVEVDFPRRKALSVETQKQNQELAAKYEVEGFPTVVLLNGDGKTLWRYDALYTGGVAAFLAELDKARKG